MPRQEPQTQRSPSYAPLAVPEPTIRLLLAAFGDDGPGEATIGALHIAVCERVRTMRDAGDQPEAVLAYVKRVTAAALTESTESRPPRPGDATALIAQVGQWCIAEYFRKS